MKTRNNLEHATSKGYDQWYIDVVYELEKLIECTTSDAQGILDAQSFIVTQAWGMDLTPAETANYVNRKSIK